MEEAGQFYYASTEVHTEVKIKFRFLEGPRPREKYGTLLNDPFLRHSFQHNSELFVTCQVFAENKPLTLPLRTPYLFQEEEAKWDSWVTFPLKYSELPLSSQLAITVWEACAPRKALPVGGTTFHLFGKHWKLKTGKRKLYLWPRTEADGSSLSQTPSKAPSMSEMNRRSKLLKKYDSGKLPRVDWLDRLALEELRKISEQEAKDSKDLFLHVFLPQFDHQVIFEEKPYPLPSTKDDRMIVLVDDGEITKDNPIEAKHLKLTRGHGNSALDRELKPNTQILKQLNMILGYPATRALVPEERDLLWKFRFYLTREKKALTKFLKSSLWEDSIEEKSLVELLDRWVDIDVDDALELLSPSFQNKIVRAYAVKQLGKADNADLILYLLQLVQALKYEKIAESKAFDSSLAKFLISKGVSDRILGNYLYWYLVVENEDKRWEAVYKKVLYHFIKEISKAPDGDQRQTILRRQASLVQQLLSTTQEMKSLDRLQKIDRLRQILADPEKGLGHFEELPLLLDPEVQVTGIVPERANIFKSAKQPLFLVLRTPQVSEYSVIFKYGDDIRQDQLVIQLIQLMDRLLRKENLDLQLTPYKVLATGANQGLLQFVNAQPLAKILEEYNNDIRAFFRKHSPDSSAEHGISPVVMDTYVKSCAGYCVITYLLGIGDRHMDNLLLATSGHLFHIDFGFILGKDPKLFPPPMKISLEMVQAMGGMEGSDFRKFRSYCFTAFNILRKSANLILNLFSLMVDSNVQDIRDDPDKAVMKVQENFQLHKTDEEAIQYFRELITFSVSALFPQVFDTMHKWAQYWRK